LPSAQLWSLARPATEKTLICYHFPLPGEPGWDSSSPRGPPRSL
jgi:hypothetical protein